MFSGTTVLLAGLIASAWRQLQFFGHKLVGLFFVRVVLSDRELTIAVGSLLWREGVAYGLGDKLYGTFARNVYGAINQVRVVPVEYGSPAGTIFKYRGRLILFIPGARATNSPGSSGEAPGVGRNSQDPRDTNNCTLVFLRGTFDPEALINRAIDAIDAQFCNASPGLPVARVHRRHVIFRSTGSRGDTGEKQRVHSPAYTIPGTPMTLYRAFRYTAEELEPLRRDEVAPFATVALSPRAEMAIRLVRHWLGARVWYVDRSIAWRLGLLLYGEPGNGKSVFAKALGCEFDLPISVFDLASMTNHEFLTCWDQVVTNAPSIALFEDIDAIYDGRAKVDANAGPSFDCFLNALGGVEPAHGVLTIITTNRPDTLDASLCAVGIGGDASRPGRIDHAVEFGPPDHAGRWKIAKRICADVPVLAVTRLVEQGEGSSGAVFEAACREVALAAYWADKDFTPEVR